MLIIHNTVKLTCVSALLYCESKQLSPTYSAKHEELQGSAVTHKYSSSAEDLTYIFKSGRLFVIREVTRGLTEKEKGKKKKKGEESIFHSVSLA